MARIALFDYFVTPNNPAGSCNLRMLQHLCEEHEFTVFSADFENPAPQRITWVQIPAPSRPLALLFVVFHLLSPFYYLAHRLRHRKRFDLVVTVEAYSAVGDVAYSHFCHRAYLRNQWHTVDSTGGRRFLRWLDHRLRSLLEPVIYRRVRKIVVPSRGLARDLGSEFPGQAHKVVLLANPVDVERMAPPADFDRTAFRRELGLQPEDVVLVFTALGHFERKGLPRLLDALARLPDERLKLLVVGGAADLVALYRKRAAALGLGERVVLTGWRQDVRPYLWAADALAFPSSYEVFSLTVHEAAAAGLPILATPLYGVEEFLRPGENGILLQCSTEGVVQGLESLVALSPAARRQFGRQAQLDVQRNATRHFIDSWRDFYRTHSGGAGAVR
jgi:glycosyltransferase involved in cell wall biosynthesis